jgi:hypothetical protein
MGDRVEELDIIYIEILHKMLYIYKRAFAVSKNRKNTIDNCYYRIKKKDSINFDFGFI